MKERLSFATDLKVDRLGGATRSLKSVIDSPEFQASISAVSRIRAAYEKRQRSLSASQAAAADKPAN